MIFCIVSNRNTKTIVDKKIKSINVFIDKTTFLLILINDSDILIYQYFYHIVIYISKKKKNIICKEGMRAESNSMSRDSVATNVKFENLKRIPKQF